MITKIFRPKTLLLVVLLIVVAALTYGFAAALTPSTSDVAAGTSGAMTDMVVDVTWALNATTPDTSPTATLTFTTGTPASGAVYAQVQDGTTAVLQVGGNDWVACAGAGPFTCTFTGVNVENIYYIRVAAGE